VVLFLNPIVNASLPGTEGFHSACHLPGTPSKNDVTKNRINLREIQAKMLKRMEEMTLQMILLKNENGLYFSTL